MLVTFTIMQRFQSSSSVSTTVPKGWKAAAFTITSNCQAHGQLSATTSRTASG